MPLIQKVMRRYGWMTLIVSYHFGTFGSHWFNVGGDIANLICDVTSQYQVVEGSWDFIGVSISLFVIILAVGCLRHCGCGNMLFLIFYEIL